MADIYMDTAISGLVTGFVAGLVALFSVTRKTVVGGACSMLFGMLLVLPAMQFVMRQQTTSSDYTSRFITGLFSMFAGVVFVTVVQEVYNRRKSIKKG